MIKIVTADDSPFLRQVLKETLEATGKVRVVGEAMNGKEAIEKVRALKPDVLILDIEMPVMNGLEALRIIMAECPLPVFMFSSLAREGASVTIKALEYGAVDFFLKPAAGARSLDQVSGQLLDKLEAMTFRTLFRRDKAAVGVVKLPPVSSGKFVKRPVDIVAVGSSTGGVQAAVEVIKRLPAKTPPIVWVQHMPAAFTGSFAARLDSLAQIAVYEAKNGQVLEPNSCYIAPGGYQMRVKKAGKAILNIGGLDRVNGFCPSCDVLFESVAQHYARNAVGVILTGMGSDGAQGLLKMRQKGAFVVGQNQDSCVVYGMPKAAFLAGAVDVETDLFAVSDVLEKVGGVG